MFCYNNLVNEETKMLETKIYIGLNDADLKTQKFETTRYTSLLKRVCMSYHLPFSFSIAEGGYFHDDGTYTQETSLILSLIDADRSTVEEMAKDLCVFFNQESILITETEVNSYFIRESL